MVSVPILVLQSAWLTLNENRLSPGNRRSISAEFAPTLATVTSLLSRTARAGSQPCSRPPRHAAASRSRPPRAEPPLLGRSRARRATGNSRVLSLPLPCICGCEFEAKPSDIARGGGRHCSRECYVTARTVFEVAGRPTLVTCETCGDAFRTPAHRAPGTARHAIYCSRSCYKIRLILKSR
jgi:hypothetical protein